MTGKKKKRGNHFKTCHQLVVFFFLPGESVKKKCPKNCNRRKMLSMATFFLSEDNLQVLTGKVALFSACLQSMGIIFIF